MDHMPIKVLAMFQIVGKPFQVNLMYIGNAECLYYKALWIYIVLTIDRLHSRLVSFLLQVTFTVMD
jgi:hypothetical protein